MTGHGGLCAKMDYDTYLLLLSLPLLLGFIYFLNCEGAEAEDPDRDLILFVNGKIAMHEDCCCCPRCTDGCNKTPRPYGTVEFSGILGHDIAGSPPPLWACTDPETETENYCLNGDDANGLNQTTFEVDCDQSPAECSYFGTTGAGQFCGLDDIKVHLHYPRTGTPGVWILLTDDEPSPSDWGEWFEVPPSYPMDCNAAQSPAYISQGDLVCEFDQATATFTPYCELP